jgi:hypothetical protein
MVAANALTRAVPRCDVCLEQAWYASAIPITLPQSVTCAPLTTFSIRIHSANRAPAASQVGQVGTPPCCPHEASIGSHRKAERHRSGKRVLLNDCIWKHRSSCSASCLTGSQSRSRSILSPSHTTTNSCPTLGDSKTCDAGACPTPDQVLGCLVTDWQGWSACPVTCDGSSYTRSRAITRPAINGGAACPTTLLQTSPCSVNECPVDCQVASWTSWGSCSYALSPRLLMGCSLII